MPSSLISTALAGGLILAMVGVALLVSDVRRPRSASALLGAGLSMWATGLYFAPPLVRMIALGLFAILALSLPSSGASKSKQSKVAGAYILPLVLPASAGPLFSVSLHRLFVVQQSPALAAASAWLAAASVILIAVALAMAPLLSAGRPGARRSG